MQDFRLVIPLTPSLIISRLAMSLPAPEVAPMVAPSVAPTLSDNVSHASPKFHGLSGKSHGL
jgi:hypothetical protein